MPLSFLFAKDAASVQLGLASGLEIEKKQLAWLNLKVRKERKECDCWPAL